MIPGSNLLTQAFGLISRQQVHWLQFQGMTTNAAGIKVPSWSDPVTIGGSIQAVPHSLVQQLGLDWTKNYVNFYAEADFTDVQRDKTGDRITYGGATYEFLSNNDWFSQDGWKGVLAVQVTNA